MGEKEITIDFRELSRMEVYCPNCGAGCLLDWPTQHAFPQTCSVCAVQFPETARKAMMLHQQFHRADTAPHADHRVRVQFRVKAPERMS